MNESDWISAHAFYHGDLDHLLIHAVEPVIDELRRDGRIEGSFFLRYWERGPHVRLRLLPAGGSDRAEIESLVVQRFGRFFEENPSPEVMSQDDYRRTASMLANWESLDSYARTLHENNALSFIPYRREHARYGYGASVEAVERHFVESSRLAMRVVTGRVPAGPRFTAAYAMILLAWFTAEPDPGRLVELIRPDEGDAPLRDQARPEPLDGWRQDQAVHTAGQMRELAAAATTMTGTGTLIEWARSMHVLCRSLSVLVAAGAFIPPSRGWEGRKEAVSKEPGARVLSVLDICAHLICNRLGVPLPVEGALRRSAAAALTALAAQGRAGREVAAEGGHGRGLA